MSGITLNIDSTPMELMEELKEQQHYKHMWKKNCLEREEEIKKLKEQTNKQKNTMSNTMDYDAFVDKLEELCNCKGQGYIKCLEYVKQLKQDNREMYRVNDHLNSLVGEDVKSQAKKYNELYVKSRERCVENRKLKKENEEQHKLNMLEAKFSTWREVMSKYDSQSSLDDEVSFLNENSNNQEHIKKVFDELYIAEYEYDIETKDYKVSGESDEEDE